MASSKLFAFGVGQQRERNRSQGRSVVDERVEPAEIAGDLHGDRVDVFLAPDVPDDPAGAGLRGDLLDRPGGAGDESDAGTSGDE